MNAIALLFVAAMSSLVTIVTYPQPRPPTVSLHNDSGGGVVDHLKFFAYMRDGRVPIAVDGDCVSSCTLVLTLPPEQVCIYPTARLGFHLASTIKNGARVDDMTITQELIDRFYPPAIQKWIKDHGPLRNSPVYMQGAEAISLGVFKSCNAPSSMDATFTAIAKILGG